MAELLSGKVRLEWSDGRSVEIGEIRMESERNGTEIVTRTKVHRKRLGWEFVKMGLRVMFPGRKEEEE